VPDLADETRCQELFKGRDFVICSVPEITAFPHDHRPRGSNRTRRGGPAVVRHLPRTSKEHDR
jgi:hypothetical protein